MPVNARFLSSDHQVVVPVLQVRRHILKLGEIDHLLEVLDPLSKLWFPNVSTSEQARSPLQAFSGDVGVVRSEAVLDDGGPDVCRARP